MPSLQYDFLVSISENCVNLSVTLSFTFEKELLPLYCYLFIFFAFSSKGLAKLFVTVEYFTIYLESTFFGSTTYYIFTMVYCFLWVWLVSIYDELLWYISTYTKISLKIKWSDWLGFSLQKLHLVGQIIANWLLPLTS